MKTPLKTKTDVEKLVEKFNQWADDRIFDMQILLPADDHRQVIIGRVDAINWAKTNLERLAREILDDKSNG